MCGTKFQGKVSSLEGPPHNQVSERCLKFLLQLFLCHYGLTVRMFRQTKAATLHCCVDYCSRLTALSELQCAVLCYIYRKYVHKGNYVSYQKQSPTSMNQFLTILTIIDLQMGWLCWYSTAGVSQLWKLTLIPRTGKVYIDMDFWEHKIWICLWDQSRVPLFLHVLSGFLQKRLTLVAAIL